MQPLQNCIGPTIRIGREILCLPYAGFLKHFPINPIANWTYGQYIENRATPPLSVALKLGLYVYSSSGTVVGQVSAWKEQLTAHC